MSSFSTTLIYDRVNIGKSGVNLPVDKPVRAKGITERLHKLLKIMNLKPPYVLVGHSAGGLYAQMYARTYPNETRGVVLIDSSSPYQQWNSAEAAKGKSAYGEDLGFPESFKQVKQAGDFPQVPLIVLIATYHGTKNPNFVFHVVGLGGKPRQYTEKQNMQTWDVLQNNLAKLSKSSMHMYAYNSRHFIQNHQPKFVVDAIYTIIKKTAHN